MSSTSFHTGGLARLAGATGLASIGLAAGGTGGALLIGEMTGSEALAGVPFALVVVGSAVGALLISALSARVGRGRALALGHLVGVAGAGIVVVGGVTDSLALVMAGSLLLGPANASIFLARYAGADLVRETQRGRAIGVMLVATAAGAIAAPNLLGPAGGLAQALGLPPSTGLYLVAIVVFSASGLLLGASRAAAMGSKHAVSVGDHPEAESRTRWAGLFVLGAANMAMVGIMAVAPVHFTGHGHGYEFIGLVISIHVAGMLVPSPLTGWLCDRRGPGVVAAAGGAVLLAAGIWGALADQADAGAATGFLLVLGLGWNLAIVAGSTMLTAGTSQRARVRSEATGEVAMGLAAGVGASAAGLLATAGGWQTLMLAAGVVGAVALAVAVAESVGNRQRRAHGSLVAE